MINKEEVLQKLWEALEEEVKCYWKWQDAQRNGEDVCSELERLGIWHDAVKESLKRSKAVRMEVERKLTLGKYS